MMKTAYLLDSILKDVHSMATTDELGGECNEGASMRGHESGRHEENVAARCLNRWSWCRRSRGRRGGGIRRWCCRWSR